MRDVIQSPLKNTQHTPNIDAKVSLAPHGLNQFGVLCVIRKNMLSRTKKKSQQLSGQETQRKYNKRMCSSTG